MKIGQVVYVIKDGKATHAIITNVKQVELPADNFIRRTIARLINKISCNRGRTYEVTYNDNTRETVQREQLEMY
jgi:hypothetical protein